MIWLSVNLDVFMDISSANITRKFHFWLLLLCGGITFQVVVGLQAQPEALTGAQGRSKAYCTVGGHAALSEYDLVDAARRNTGRADQGVLADPQGDKELVEEHFARMDVGQTFMVTARIQR